MSGGPKKWDEYDPVTRGCAAMAIVWLAAMGVLVAAGVVLPMVWK